MDAEPSRKDQRRWAAPFFTIWSGQAVSLLGSRLVQFGLVWWLNETADSATALAMATLVALLPGIFIAPIAGALIDRWNRRVVMIVADGFIALATMGLAVLFALGVAHPWHIYLILFIRSTAGGFHWTAMRVSTSLMVPEQQLSRVEGLNQTLNGILTILGPPLGALLLELLPLQGILAIDVGTAILAIVPLFFIAIPQPQRRAAPTGMEVEKPSLGQDLREGFRYVWNWPGLLAILLMAMAINFLFTPGSALMPRLVTNHFGGEALQLGWLQSVFGAGVILGGIILSTWGGFKRRILTTLMGLIGLGLGFATVGLAPASAFWLALVAKFFAGIMNPITNGPLHAVVQAKVAPEMQGRVFTLIQSGATAMTPLGLVIAGPVADWLGIQTWYIVGGVVCTLMGIAAFFVPAIVHFEDNHNEQQVADGVEPVSPVVAVAAEQ